MALTDEEQAVVNRLRLRTGERLGPNQSDSESMFTDDELMMILADSSDQIDIATLAVWIAKVAEYASLYDREESGSANKMSQLYRQASAEVTRWTGIAGPALSVSNRVPVGGKSISWLRDNCDDGLILWTPVRNRAYTPGNWVTN